MIFLKKLLKALRKFFYHKILKKRYVRKGSCLRCGKCCKNIYVRHNSKVIKTQEEFEEIKKQDPYSFYHHISVVSKDEMGLVFKCNKFDEENKLCTDHRHRPSICRNYPSEDIFQMGAELCETCGFRFEPVESFEEVFEKIKKHKKTKNYVHDIIL